MTTATASPTPTGVATGTMAQDAPGEAAGRPSLATAWWMVGALFLIYVFAWLDRLTVSMLVPPIKQQMALTDFQMSLILGPAFALSYAVFAIPLGWAADRFPRRIVIFCGVGIWAMATLACGFAATFGELMAARVIVGIGEAALLPAAVCCWVSCCRDLPPPWRPRRPANGFASSTRTHRKARPHGRARGKPERRLSPRRRRGSWTPRTFFTVCCTGLNWVLQASRSRWQT